MKKIIVVISTYNGAKHIERQLNSIFEQTGVDVQVLVRDDCSRDNTVEVVQKYAQTHPQNKIEIIKGNNVGFAKSFWLGLSMCGNADYYAFADQDDVWKKDKVQKVSRQLEKYKIVVHDAELINGDGDTLGKRYYECLHSKTSFI